MRPPPLRRQRGLSLVELMVGAALGLFMAAAGGSLLASHLRENRGLLLEARLMQDLRTAADLITHDLRRAGHWGAAGAGVWTAAAGGVIANPYSALSPAAAASDAVAFSYSRDTIENHAVDSNERFGFRLRSGVVELQLGAGNWQALTDSGTMTVTAFSVTPTVEEIDLTAWCARPCPAGSAAICPPRQQVRSLAVLIRARSATDAALVRSLSSQVRVRNDALVGGCPA